MTFPGRWAGADRERRACCTWVVIIGSVPLVGEVTPPVGAVDRRGPGGGNDRGQAVTVRDARRNRRGSEVVRDLRVDVSERLDELRDVIAGDRERRDAAVPSIRRAFDDLDDASSDPGGSRRIVRERAVRLRSYHAGRERRGRRSRPS